MKKFKISLTILLLIFFKNNLHANNTEIFKKIDVFGEVLEKINTRYR